MTARSQVVGPRHQLEGIVPSTTKQLQNGSAVTVQPVSGRRRAQEVLRLCHRDHKEQVCKEQ